MRNFNRFGLDIGLKQMHLKIRTNTFKSLHGHTTHAPRRSMRAPAVQFLADDHFERDTSDAYSAMDPEHRRPDDMH